MTAAHVCFRDLRLFKWVFRKYSADDAFRKSFPGATLVPPSGLTMDGQSVLAVAMERGGLVDGRGPVPWQSLNGRANADSALTR